MKKIVYIIKEEVKVFNVYMKNGNTETFDCSFNIKEKAEKYIEAMNI